MKSMRVSLLIFLAIVGSAWAESKQHPVSGEQTEFSAEDEGVKRPTTIPQDVMAILSRDEIVQKELENENLQPDKLPTSWFSASLIHLSTARPPDLIVVGQPPINGANVAWFWIFRLTSQGHKLVLFGGGHDLRVTSRYSKGFREIELLSVTLGQFNTLLYRFDGQEYRRYKATSEKIQ
jgi:hypothetical protein